MFDDNKDTGSLNPEEHKENPVNTNFVMRDPDPKPAQQNIPHYQEYQFRKSAGPSAYEEVPPRKKRGFVKKAAALVSGALVFGVIAGSTMVGINYAAGAYGNKNSVEINKAETVSTTAPAPASNTSAISGVNDVSGIVDKAMPSVVAITSKVVYESQTWFGPMQREG